jgi:hypothetical protein
MIDHALGDDPKAALIAARQLKEEVEWLTERSVSVARREGYDWGQISRLLGMSRQWARERFKTAPPRLPPHVVARNRYLADQREAEQALRRYEAWAERKRRGGPERDEDSDDVVAW